MTRSCLTLSRRPLQHVLHVLHLLGALMLACAAGPSHAGEAVAPARFAGHWEDCENFSDACYGYRLEQRGAQVCGSLTRAAKTGDEPKRHGHIRGRVDGALLVDVSVCGVEARTPCPKVMPANRRGLLACGDTVLETGGRVYTCANYSERSLAKPYRRVSAEAFDKRFGPPPPSLCDVAVTSDLPASASR